ncbi:uncharacterized protein ChaoS9_165 [Halobacterium phage ChaoS9]|uniref:Uncharacterized protein n=1 Tax=Halobacterium phage ChaoS9 TaxID=2847105 RepID=A0A481V9T3_9CAUD|nr:uncharacterized protein KMC41_gp34 [Halobacterium phage ChaoS9]QBI90040.1 uncharacterized protein ChaoS9_165 [Halobacterium phage ChaoS9]
MELIFTPDDSGTMRATGYATVSYSSDADDETVAETTESELTAIFEDAKANSETLDGADKSIDAAIDEPLAFLDYLILNGKEIIFDEDHSRNQEK